MSGRSREFHLEVQEGSEALSEVREHLVGPPEGPGGVRRPTRRSGRSQGAHLKVREGSVGPPGGPGIPRGGPGGVERHTQRSGWGW